MSLVALANTVGSMNEPLPLIFLVPPGQIELPQEWSSGSSWQPYSGHASRQSLKIYSRMSLAEAQEEYDQAIKKFPV
jgi:hypothetical protein